MRATAAGFFGVLANLVERCRLTLSTQVETALN
jgi:hypothetical protein